MRNLWRVMAAVVLVMAVATVARRMPRAEGAGGPATTLLDVKEWWCSYTIRVEGSETVMEGITGAPTTITRSVRRIAQGSVHLDSVSKGGMPGWAGSGAATGGSGGKSDPNQRVWSNTPSKQAGGRPKAQMRVDERMEKVDVQPVEGKEVDVFTERSTSSGREEVRAQSDRVFLGMNGTKKTYSAILPYETINDSDIKITKKTEHLEEFWDGRKESRTVSEQRSGVSEVPRFRDLKPAVRPEYVLEQALPEGVQPLQGSVSYEVPMAGMKKPVTVTIQWSFSPGPPSVVKLIMKPVGYEEWRPLCGVSEDVKGNDLGIEWRITEQGGNALQPTKVRSVTFLLLNTSKYPGVCMNWPVRAKAPADFDLKFAGANAAQAGIAVRDFGQAMTVKTAQANARSGVVRVESFDSGAHGTLIAEALLEDGRVVQAVVEKSAEGHIAIPDVESGASSIARCWRKENAPGKKDDADDETFPPGDGQVGDGLTVWEEYRGFWINGKPEGCDPKTKDLLVLNEIGGMAHNGIMLFGQATSIGAHECLVTEEFKADRVVNFNSGGQPHVVDQHLIRVTEGGGGWKESGGKGPVIEMEATASICNTDTKNRATFPGPPKNTLDVSILPSMLRRGVPVLQLREGESYSVAYADLTIAHELCHGIGIRHHGDKDKGYQPWKYELAKGGGYMVWFEGIQVFVRNEAGKILGPSDLFAFMAPQEETDVYIGERNGQMSGDEACLMRYDIAHGYRSLKETKTLYYYTDRETWGNRLCTSPAGTGKNMPTHEPQSRFGGADTGRGDCAHRFVVSDLWEKKK